jgi:hypothetical protein
MDAFGRVYETRSKAAKKGESTIAGSDFLAQRPYVTDSSLSTVLVDSHLDPQRKIAFERQKSPSGSAFISVKITKYSHDGISGQDEVVDYLDCIKQIRKRSARDADDVEKVWLYWEYDSQGQHRSESFPTRVSASVDLDWIPDSSAGKKSTFDILGRPLLRIRPAHGDQNHLILTETNYLDGGANVQEKTLTAKDASVPLSEATQLALLQRRYVRIGKEEHIMENIDENGLRSQFAYNAVGDLIQCTDSAGQKEIRSYNSKGDIVSLDNPYQNIAGVANSPAIQYQYNAAGHRVAKSTQRRRPLPITEMPKAEC